jgi:two-component system, chemotaxis family, chemotaxis protein CheY
MNGNDFHVLIVDDMKLARVRVKQACERIGLKNFQEATNGNEAWGKIVGGFVPHLILTDFNMPDMNGLQFLDLVRKHEMLKETPVVMITSESEKQVILSAVNLGITEFVIKPFSDEILTAKISSVLKKKK